MKYCIVIADGLPDQRYSRFKNCSPLEIARTPGMDKIASQGRMGVIKTVPDDLPAQSLVAVMSILGIDPLLYYTGPAAFEAHHFGLECNADEWVFCCDLVSTFAGTLVDPRAGQIRGEEANILLQDMQKALHEPVRFHPIKSYHQLAMIRGDFTHLKTSAPDEIVNQPIPNHYPTGPGKEIIIQLMEKAHQLLRNHDINHVRCELGENPANSIWLWGNGKIASLPRFQDLFGLQACIISSSFAIQGLAQLLGIQKIEVSSITDTNEINYINYKETVLTALQQYDMVILDFNALVEISHYGDLTKKVRVLEQLDDKIIGPLLVGLENDYALMVVGGHWVSVEDRCSHHNPVPFAIFGDHLPGGTGLKFTEENASKLDLYIRNGHELMKFFLQSSNP